MEQRNQMRNELTVEAIIRQRSLDGALAHLLTNGAEYLTDIHQRSSRDANTLNLRTQTLVPGNGGSLHMPAAEVSSCIGPPRRSLYLHPLQF